MGLATSNPLHASAIVQVEGGRLLRRAAARDAVGARQSREGGRRGRERRPAKCERFKRLITPNVVLTSVAFFYRNRVNYIFVS